MASDEHDFLIDAYSPLAGLLRSKARATLWRLTSPTRNTAICIGFDPYEHCDRHRAKSAQVGYAGGKVPSVRHHVTKAAYTTVCD